MSDIKVVWSVMISIESRWVGSERVWKSDSNGEKVGRRIEASPVPRQPFSVTFLILADGD
jgi:hypothetical protein